MIMVLYCPNISLASCRAPFYSAKSNLQKKKRRRARFRMQRRRVEGLPVTAEDQDCSGDAVYNEKGIMTDGKAVTI